MRDVHYPYTLEAPSSSVLGTDTDNILDYSTADSKQSLIQSPTLPNSTLNWETQRETAEVDLDVLQGLRDVSYPYTLEALCSSVLGTDTGDNILDYSTTDSKHSLIQSLPHSSLKQETQQEIAEVGLKCDKG